LVSISRQNGQETATALALVANASWTLLWPTRAGAASSNHIRPPPRAAACGRATLSGHFHQLLVAAGKHREFEESSGRLGDASYPSQVTGIMTRNFAVDFRQPRPIERESALGGQPCEQLRVVQHLVIATHLRVIVLYRL
jgi:hypothetical protein